MAVWYNGVLKAPYGSKELSKLVKIVEMLGSFLFDSALKFQIFTQVFGKIWSDNETNYQMRITSLPNSAAKSSKELVTVSSEAAEEALKSHSSPDLFAIASVAEALPDRHPRLRLVTGRRLELEP